MRGRQQQIVQYVEFDILVRDGGGDVVVNDRGDDHGIDDGGNDRRGRGDVVAAERDPRGDA